jgi:hypothetical protein
MYLYLWIGARVDSFVLLGYFYPYKLSSTKYMHLSCGHERIISCWLARAHVGFLPQRKGAGSWSVSRNFCQRAELPEMETQARAELPKTEAETVGNRPLVGLSAVDR